MLVHLDTSLLVDAFTGTGRSLEALRTATADGDVITFSTIVLYEWLRGPRAEGEKEAVDQFFASDMLAVFGAREAERAAALYRQVKRARQRQADLAIAACALEHSACLWTLNRADFDDISELTLYER
ncbi:MAG: PIN domain-containing protein [Luteitalea sp.]|nr:PIN domain-containing protein [Luteitalea sp.]